MKHTVTISWDDEENDEAPTWEEFLEVYILDEMHGYIDDLDLSDRTKNHAQDIVSKIIRHLNRYVENQKGVDAEPVRPGKWIKKYVKHYCPRDDWSPRAGFEKTWNEEEGSWLENEYFCSECGFQPTYSNEKPWYNYCPNCGAKMDAEQENEQSEEGSEVE